jgi:RNA polymerase sigma-70 factor, ECF subfamily
MVSPRDFAASDAGGGPRPLADPASSPEAAHSPEAPASPEAAALRAPAAASREVGALRGPAPSCEPAASREPASRHDPSDEEVVAAVLSGATERFALLVHRHQEALYRQACSMGVDADTAEDLVQDALVRAFEGLDGWREQGRFRVWVIRILRNRCLDHLKSAPTQRNHPLHPTLPDRSGGPERDQERRALGALLEEAMRRIAPEQREAFLLRHVEGFSYEETAEITGASMSAMKMRVHRARDALREHLRRSGFEGGVTAEGGSSS